MFSICLNPVRPQITWANCIGARGLASLLIHKCWGLELHSVNERELYMRSCLHRVTNFNAGDLNVKQTVLENNIKNIHKQKT